MSSTPATLGKYQIIREIARSNDIVYEAYDPLMNRRVALKELAIPHGSSTTQRDERIRRFQREVKAAGSLAHPNLMTVYEVGMEGDRHYMAMEFLDGHTLRNEIDTRGFMDIARAVKTATEILEGLEFAHRHGVIHRDIKPDNIQLTESGRVKITDFGIARLTFEPNLTMDGQVFGTPSYMSPEQVTGKEIDCRSDVFSVGILLYEMITGQKPFPGDSIVAITHAIVHAHPARPAQMSDPMWAVVQRSLQKQPSMRFADAGEMIAALANANRPTPVAPPAMPIPTPAPSPPSYAYNPMPPQGAPVGPVFGTPYGQNPNQPAPTYGQNYNPGAPNPLPVYYPPPPRQPLFAPETRLFFRRLAVISLLVGSLFALVFVGIREISNVIERDRVRKKEMSIRDMVGSGNPGTTLDDKVRIGEEKLKQLTDKALISDAMGDLAALYEQRGKVWQQQGRLELAEADFSRAISYDKDNALLYTNLGSLYSEAARRTTDGHQASLLYDQSAAQWKQAMQLSGGNSGYRDAVAGAYFNASERARLMGSLSEQQDYLNRAREYATPNSEVEQRIHAALGGN
ncbi:MAG: protein kinase [Chthonomonas sp.]|nr:protein kinase [Chthonomonas sp.]